MNDIDNDSCWPILNTVCNGRYRTRSGSRGGAREVDDGSVKMKSDK